MREITHESDRFSTLSRRSFLTAAGTGLVAATLAGGAVPRVEAQQILPPSDPAESPIPLPPTSAKTEKQSPPSPLPQPPSERVGFAVVGLGNLALSEIIPAFGQCKRAKLAALVSGSLDKAQEVAAQNGIPAKNTYTYDTYDALKDNPDVDVIYIVLPNGMHAEYTVRGAQAGKHILCEKPMATSSKDCQAMIDACKKANKKLMIAYRIQYEPNNRHIQKMVRTNQHGTVKFIESVNGQDQGDPNQWRQKKSLAGGGSLPDVGLYCLNTTRFLLGMEPEEVTGQVYSTPNDPRFREVEENCIFQLRFPNGLIATGASGYGFHESRRYRVYSETGWFGMDPAFSYNGLQMQLSYADGDIEYRQTPQIDPKNHFATEMDHMAECVRQDKTPYTPGEEGLQDQKIMEAIYESARTGKPVKLERFTGLDVFRGTEPA